MANETTKRLMARVKQIRLARGLTQEQFAEHADLDPKYYQHAEAGRKLNPELETLIKLSNGCNLKLHELLNFDHEPAVQSPAPAASAKKRITPHSPKARPKASSSLSQQA